MKRSSKLTLTMAGTLFSTAIIAPAIVYGATTGKVTVETLNIREEPSTSGSVIGSLDEGDSVNVLSETDGWYKIKLSSGTEAYVSARYVKLDGELTTNDNTENPKDTTEQGNSNEMAEGEEIRLRKDTIIRSLPAYFSAGINKLYEDTSVTFIERINNWICVEYNKVRGWVFSRDSISVSSEDIVGNETPERPVEEKPEEKEVIKTGYVSVSSAFVRKEGSTNADVITSFSLNNEVSIIDEKDNWYQIKLNTTTGWIYKPLVSDEKTEVTSRGSITRTPTVSQDYKSDEDENEDDENYIVSNNASQSMQTSNGYDNEEEEEYYEEEYEEEYDGGYVSDLGNDVVDFAMQYKGRAYSYGASGPYSFDCSGFTMYVFSHFGVSLPHNARTQSYYGSWVSRNDLQPGDLLIFNDRANTSIGHSGIYIGDGLFIHAENPSNGVTVTSIWSNYYSARYVEARRLV